MAFELLETLRWTPEERWYLLDRHLARLHASARYFGFPYSPQAVAEALGAAENGADQPLRVRLLLAEDGATRVERTPLNIERRRMRVRLATQPVDPDDVFLYHKTTNRAVYERARLPDCDDVILWNGLGEATESTIANLVVEIDGRRVTPPVSCGLLPGTMRAELLANGEIVEGRFSVDALRSTPIWLVNSVRGWCDADLVD